MDEEVTTPMNNHRVGDEEEKRRFSMDLDEAER